MVFTSVLEAIILGSAQGLTEFLPVSSTAHLVVLQHVFGLDQRTYGLSFDMFANLGTTLALIWFFREDLATLVRRLRLPKEGAPLSIAEKVPWWILSVTIIVGATGYLLEHLIASTFRSLPLIAGMLVFFGIVMLLAEKYAATHPRTTALSATRAYGVGLAQIIAFVPGVSRSGATISTGLFLGLTREEAARFSFLLSVPITLAAIGKRMVTVAGDFAVNPPSADVILFYMAGLISAGVVGYFSIRFLLTYLRTSSLAAFSYYRFALAAAILVYLAIR
ncbi:MAG TPA: undecaprenyl-diphosphate phosphatase [Verrucomicrobiae bacterium]|nr:undecaprenyl-diphosphate phosphatase [Verrucomicrobiae bacterium]